MHNASPVPLNRPPESSDGSWADCAIFDEEVFCFIELKDCKNKNIPTNRRKAKEQLIATIEFFRENINIKQKLEAYICITCSTLEFEEFFDTQLFYRCKKLFHFSSH